MNEKLLHPAAMADLSAPPAEKVRTRLWLPDSNRESPPPPSAAGPPGVRVSGKYLTVNGRRFYAKGVTYGSFARNEAGEPFPPFPQLCDDFKRMREAGINTVRIYSPPSDRIADAAAAAGLYLIPDISWGPRRCELDDPDHVKSIFKWTRDHARRLAGHPAMLLYSIGNEVPPLIVRWYGRQRIERLLGAFADTIREQAPGALITYSNHPPTEYLHLPFLDVVSYNVYLHKEDEFRAYLSRLQTLAGGRPLFLSELGLNSLEYGEDEQARFLRWQLRAVFEKGLCGAAVYSWTDEWTIFNSDISGWAFGLTTAERKPKMALSAVRDTYIPNLYRLRPTPWPLVTVVVAAYNAGATLDECLAGLCRMTYPNYEILVINDGSTDDTAAIAERYAVRRIDVPNGGLSRARNLGIEKGRGEIIAFIDSDAWPDPDWLYHLVNVMDEEKAAAAGGPNIAPEGDGFVAECVDCSPGNPTHVLLSDQRAEHIPGCNMAFRKSALEEIGKFDAKHRIAGDDVDVCWKLLVRRRTIAFSPAALVHHHRRGTVRGYLRQQKNYGTAEAHLQTRYPGRYNFFGHQVWQGNIYDTVHDGLRQRTVPFFFISKIYQGRFGGEQFQSIYQPYLTFWFQIFTAIEWQGASLCALLSGVTGLLVHARMAGVALGMGVLMALLCLGSAVVCAREASRSKPWRGTGRFMRLTLIAFLHLAQPWARGFGRFKGWWQERKSGRRYPAVQRLYGNLSQREQLLEGLQSHFADCGWISQPASSWSEHDLEISGPGPWGIFLTTVYEENLDRQPAGHYVRYRLTGRIKRFTPVFELAMVLALGALCFFPWLLPVGIPIVLVLRKYFTARATMINAISQLTEEYGAALGMTKAENEKM